MRCITFIISLIILQTCSVTAVELTFELPDNDKQCYYETIKQGEKSTIEFQVLSGGNYDVDVILESPTGEVLYHEKKIQDDAYTWIADIMGDYKLCFSNEFSSFSHKSIYMDFNVGEEKPLPGIGDRLTALTESENSCFKVHKCLNVVIDHQTHQRLKETQERDHFQELHIRVQYWSILEIIVIFFNAIGQVIVLRNFFTDKK